MLTSHNVIFRKAAAEILNIHITRIDVRRQVTTGPNYGKLTVYVYRMDDELKQYYHMDNGATKYRALSPYLATFKRQLKKKI